MNISHLINRVILAAIAITLATPQSVVAQAAAANNTNDPEPKALVQILPRGLTVNQKGFLLIRVPDTHPTKRPVIPVIKGLTLQRKTDGLSRTNGKQYYDFLYQVTSIQAGPVEIPPIRIETNDGPYWTPRTVFTVRDNPHLDALAKSGSQAFMEAWTPETPAFQRQSFPFEITLYTTTNANIVLAEAVPNFRHEGFSVSRVERRAQGQALINGQRFDYQLFQGMITPLNSGELSIDDITIDLVTVNHRASGIFSQREEFPLTAEGPDHTFTVKPLPDNAPANFSGAVGKFNMAANLIHTPEKEGDPVEIELVISGEGNAEFITEPVIIDPDELWKSYNMGASRTTQNDGSIVFNKVLRPTAPTKTVPSFEFCFFNPEEGAYVVLATTPVDLPWDLAKFPKPGALIENQSNAMSSPAPQPRVLAFPSIESPSWTSTAAVTSTRSLMWVNLTGAVLAIGLAVVACTRRSAPPESDTLTRDQAVKLLKLASTQTRPLGDRLHALATIRDALPADSIPDDSPVDWHVIANVHDRLHYNFSDGTAPSPDDESNADREIGPAVSQLKRAIHHLA